MSIVETYPKTQHPSRYPIAALYQRFVLDPSVEVARAISYDFVQRPRHYRAVPDDVAGILESFRIRTGTDPAWPSATQRAQLFAPMFDDAFRTICSDLRFAARVFTERGAEVNLDLLEDRVRDAAVALRGHLQTMEGRVASRADSETDLVFRGAVEVFRNKEVAGLFGLPPAPGGNWPLDGALQAEVACADGAFLIEEIQRALGIRPVVTQHLFILFQRVAYYGAMTIAGVLEDAAWGHGHDETRALVRNAYGWETALQASLAYIEDQDKGLQPRVVSRVALDDEELKSLPTEEEAKSSGAQLARAAGGGGGLRNTCTYGWTRVCDNPGPGQSCTYGSTWYCDTGPTCTNGWTVKCDKPHAIFSPGGVVDVNYGGFRSFRE